MNMLSKKEAETLIGKGSDEKWPDDVFSFIVQHYEGLFFKSAFHSEAKRLLTRMIKPGSKVLELGCSTGLLISLAEELSGKPGVGVDIDPVRVQKANLRFNVKRQQSRAIVSDLQVSLPIPSENFDVAIMWEVIEHLQTPEIILAEIRRVLRPNGLLLISTPNTESVFHKFLSRFQNVSLRRSHNKLQYDPNFHWTELTGGELRQLVGKSGFCITAHYYYRWPKVHRYAYSDKSLLSALLMFLYRSRVSRFVGMNQVLVATKC